MASNKSVDGADGVGDVVRMIVRDSDVGADLDLVLADKGWAMIRRSALWKRVGREKERERERACGRERVPCLVSHSGVSVRLNFPETNSGKIELALGTAPDRRRHQAHEVSFGSSYFRD